MKKHSLLIRAVMTLLCLSMLLSALAACAEKGNNESKSTQAPNNETVETGPELDENGYIKDSLPADLNFNKTFNILATSHQKGQFYAEETDEHPVGMAIYSRNETVAERLGIELNWKWELGSEPQTEIDRFTMLIENDNKSGNQYDCVIAYNLVPYSLVSKGVCTNLADTKYIDLTAPWWPEVFTDRMLYKDKIFALVSSCETGTLKNLSAIYFNNDLIEDKLPQGVDPYEMVANNEWTVANLKELIKETYEDRGTIGKVEGDKDLFGLATSTQARLTCWYVGFGARLSDKNAEGELILTASDEKLGQVIDAINDLFSTQDSYLVDPKQFVMFKEERAIFYLGTLSLSSYLVSNEAKINYGIVPMPKLDAEQPRYYTHVPNWHEAWMISSGVDDKDCSSAFIECMASEAYRQINVVYFEENLKLRLAPDERLAPMYDLIRESISFDFLYIYKNILTENCDTYIQQCLVKPDKNKWATKWASIEPSVTSDFNKIVAMYEDGSAS